MTEDAFSHVTITPEGVDLDFVRSDGVERITVHRGEPCADDCLCSSLLYDGVLYGPATRQDCMAAALALPDDADWSVGLTTYLHEGQDVMAQRPLSDL